MGGAIVMRTEMNRPRPERGWATRWPQRLVGRLQSAAQKAAFLAIAVVVVCHLDDDESVHRGQPTRLTHPNAGNVRSLVFEPDGSTLWSIGIDGSVGGWDLTRDQSGPSLSTDFGDTRAVTFTRRQPILRQLDS